MATRAMEMHRMEGKPVPLAVHIACDGNEDLKSQVHKHLQFRRRSKRRKESVMEAKSEKKVVKAKATRKPRKAKKVKRVVLLGYQATHIGGVGVIVSRVMEMLKRDKITHISIPVGHFAYSGGFACEEAAKAGVHVTVVAPNLKAVSGLRMETKERLEELLKGKGVELLDLGFEDADLRDASIYREVARHLLQMENTEYAIALNNNPHTLDDIKVAGDERVTVQWPVAFRGFRLYLKKAKAKFQESVEKEMAQLDVSLD